MELNLKIERTPVGVGGGETIYLDLEDIAVMERAEAASRHLNAIMDAIEGPAEDATEDDKVGCVAGIIRKANAYAKEAIDVIFDEPIAAKIWGNSSCIAFGDTVSDSRFSRAVAELLELYRPAIEKMEQRDKEQSDSYVGEVLNEGDGPV